MEWNKVLGKVCTILTFILVVGLSFTFCFGLFANMYYVQELSMGLSITLSVIAFLIIGAGFTKLIKLW